jgi:hypothetical protein
MTVGVVRTQGTELFLLDTVRHSTPTRVKMACPTGITGMGGAKDQIDSSCLDTTGDKEFEGGLGNPGPVNVPFNMIPREQSHQILFDLKEDGSVLKWMACLSEGNDVPTVAGSNLVAPTDRTSFAFSAYVADVNIDIANNEIVRGTLTLQRSGPVVMTPFVPA